MTRYVSLLCVAGMFCSTPLFAADPTGNPPVSATDIAARLSNLQQGSSYVRLVMQIKPSHGSPSTLQIQIKQRRTAERTDLLYQILWPKERKGEAVLMHRAGGGSLSGVTSLPSGGLHELTAGQMADPLFGSSLSCEDAIEDFFAWPSQSLAGTETVNRVDCVILESKPGGVDHSPYGRVRSWIDPRRLVPMRVEKYLSSGKLARRIDTTRVANDDNGKPIPANLAVQNLINNTEAELDGSRIRHNVTYADNDFSPDGLKNLAPPHAAAH